jgi:hypothetical protein
VCACTSSLHTCPPRLHLVGVLEREREMVCPTCLYTYVSVKERHEYIVYVCGGGDIREERGRDRLRNISIDTDRGKNFTSVQAVGKRGCMLEDDVRGQLGEDKEGVQVRDR